MAVLPDEYGQFKKTYWTPSERDNLKLVVGFVEGIKSKQFDEVLRAYADSPYIQHNRSIPSGISGVVETNRTLAKRFPEFTLIAKHVYVDGDFVTFHSHVTLSLKHRNDDQKGLNVIDIWKIENGQIVEHWDAIQPLDFLTRFFFWVSGGAVKNQNGVF